MAKENRKGLDRKVKKSNKDRCGRRRKRNGNRCNGSMKSNISSSKNKRCSYCWTRVDKSYATAKIPILESKNKSTWVQKDELCKSCANLIEKFSTLRSANSISFSSLSCIALNSRLKDGGLGLFALKNFSKGEVITSYDGITESVDESNSNNSRYRIEVALGKVKDGSPKRNPMNLLKLGAYCNDRYPDVNENNAHFFVIDDDSYNVQLKASTNISEGSEIFASYGSAYFNK